VSRATERLDWSPERISYFNGGFLSPKRDSCCNRFVVLSIWNSVCVLRVKFEWARGRCKEGEWWVGEVEGEGEVE